MKESRIAAAFTRTESAVRPPNARLVRLGPMLIPLGNAAKPGGREIAKAEPDQKPVSIHPGVARLARQPCAKQRIDRSDEGESQPASYHGRQSARSVVVCAISPKFFQGMALSVSPETLPMIGPRWSPNPKARKA